MKKKDRPQPTRPTLQEGYGLTQPEKPGDFLPWEWVEERLSKCRIYWVSTTRPDGRPHTMPVWGIWCDGSFVFGTDRNSRKARNLAANPAVAVHTETGEDAVIFEGTAREIELGPQSDPMERAYLDKYEMKLGEAPGDLAVFEMTPRVVFAWRERDFNQIATRWKF